MGNLFSSKKKGTTLTHQHQKNNPQHYQYQQHVQYYPQTSYSTPHTQRVEYLRTQQASTSTLQTVNIQRTPLSTPTPAPTTTSVTIRQTATNQLNVTSTGHFEHRPVMQAVTPSPVQVPQVPVNIRQQTDIRYRLPATHSTPVYPPARPTPTPVPQVAEQPQSQYDTAPTNIAITAINGTYKLLTSLIKRYVDSCLEPELSKNAIIREMDMQEMAWNGYCVFIDTIRIEDQDVYELEEEEEFDSEVCRFTVSKDSAMNQDHMHNPHTFAKELKQKSGIVLWNFETKKVLAEGRVINSNLSKIEAMLKCTARNLEAWIDRYPESLALVTSYSPITRDRVQFLSSKVLPHMIANRSSLFASIVSFLDGNNQQPPATFQRRYNEFSSSINRGGCQMFQQLNDSQKQAVQGALDCSHFYMIHGPPGTGKSQTLVVILEALFKANKKVLVCAESHNPIDNLLSKFVETSEHLQTLTTDEKRAALIRIGASWLVDRNSKEFLLEYRLKDYKKKSRRMRGISGQQQPQDSIAADNRHKLALISKAKMVFSTKCGLFNKLFRDHFAFEENKFDYAVVDEASQSFTAFTLMAIACAKKIIFAGDHKQLPPVIKDEAAKQELEVSLFERLINHQNLHPPQTPVYSMLDTQ